MMNLSQYGLTFFSQKSFARWFLHLLLGWVLFSGVQAQTPDVNWKMLCGAELGQNAKGCSLRINAQFMNDKNMYAGVGGLLFIRASETTPGTYEMMAQLPITSQLNIPVYLAAPDGTPFIQLTYLSCGNKTTCSATAPITPEVLSYLTEIKHDLWLSYTNGGKPVYLLLAMQSFAEQFSALQKR